MLINPLSRPLDLVGDKDINYVQNEVHEIVELADRIFVPVHGPFYRESLEIIDSVTGKKLKENEDYIVLHLLQEISKISIKEVYAVIYVLKNEVSKVSISYRVPGGKYSDLSDLYIELIKNYANYHHPVYWSKIMGLPTVYPVVPHMHPIMDLDQLGELVTALDLVINAIYSRDFENWIKVYEYLDEKLKAYHDYKNEVFFNIETRANALLAKASPFVKEFWFFNKDIDPNIDYPYGTWQQRGDYLLYGQMHNEVNKMSSFGIPAGAGLGARKLALWQFMQHTRLFSYKITTNKTSVPEGGTITFTLITTGGTGGETLKYKLSGMMTQLGEVTLNSSGVATLTVNVPMDSNTNGKRKLRMTLVDQPYVYKEVEVTDVQRANWFNIGFFSDQYGLNAISSIDEGDTGYVVIKSENVIDGTVVNLIYDGSLESTDLLAPLPTTVEIYDNLAAIQIRPKENNSTDGEKYLRVGISVDNIVVPSVATLFYVRDTSKTPSVSTYWTNSPTSIVPIVNIGEGSVAYLVIETTNIPTTVSAKLTWGGSTISDDFISTLPASVAIDASGRTVIPVQVKTDNMTEGVEILEATIKIGTEYLMTTSIFIDDISRNDNIDVRFSTNSIGTNNLSTVNEGSSIYLVVKTEDIPTEGKLKLLWSGTSNANDFLTELPEFLNIKNNFGFLNILIKADEATEGNETLSVAIYDQAQTTLLSTQSITILDSSKAPTYAVSFSGEDGKLVPISTAKESDVVYGVIQTTQIPDGTVLFVETLIGNAAATTANGDVLIDVAKTVVIDNNIAFLPIHLRMDGRKDGDKDITIRVRKDNPNTEVLATNRILIKDTSVVPTYKLEWSSTYDKLTPLSTASAGQTVYARISTTSIAPGTALYLEYGQAGIGGENTDTDFLQAHSSEILPRITRIDGDGNAIVPITISKTLLGNKPLVLRLTVSRDATNATYVLSSTLNISKPTYALTFASNQAGTSTITSAKKGQTIYAVIRTTNIPNYTVFDVHTRIGNEVAVTGNKDVTQDVAKQITVVNNIGTIPIMLAKDGINKGTELIDFNLLYDHMCKDEEMIYFATATINLLES